MERSKEEKLAYEIATILNDLDSIDWHIANANKYAEPLLRSKLQYVLNKKGIHNRAGYYNTLIQMHGKQHSRN